MRTLTAVAPLSRDPRPPTSADARQRTKDGKIDAHHHSLYHHYCYHQSWNGTPSDSLGWAFRSREPTRKLVADEFFAAWHAVVAGGLPSDRARVEKVQHNRCEAEVESGSA